MITLICFDSQIKSAAESSPSVRVFILVDTEYIVISQRSSITIPDVLYHIVNHQSVATRFPSISYLQHLCAWRKCFDENLSSRISTRKFSSYKIESTFTGTHPNSPIVEPRNHADRIGLRSNNDLSSGK